MVLKGMATVPAIAMMIAIGAGWPSLKAADDASPVETNAPASAEDDAAVIRELLAQIAAQKEEIFSAKITYRWTLVTYLGAENTPERVRALLDEYDLLDDPDSLRELVFTMNPMPVPPDPPWESRTFEMLGDNRRADTSRDVIQLVDGEHEMFYHGKNSQLRIDQRGNSHVHLVSIEDFRSYPVGPPYGLWVEDFRIVGREADRLTLELIPPDSAPPDTIPNRYTFDRATGVMTHFTRHINGLLEWEIWQRALTEYPGGIVMPALRIDTHYREGRLKSLRVFIIDEAEYNGPVPEDRFVMPVAAGTVLVDQRFPKKRVHRTKTETNDVRSILAPVNTPAAGVSRGNGPGWRTILILNGVVLIVLATILWRKASLSPSPPAGAGSPNSESS